MLKTKLLFILIFLLTIGLFFLKINNKNSQSNHLNDSNDESIFNFYKNDFLSLWEENNKKKKKALESQRIQEIPVENKIIKEFDSKKKIEETLAISLSLPIDQDKKKWINDLNPGLTIIEATSEVDLINNLENLQKNALRGINLSGVEKSFDFDSNIEKLKKFDLIILPSISFFLEKDNYQKEIINLEELIISLQENQTIVLIDNYPSGLNSHSPENFDWDIYKSLITKSPFLGFVVDNVKTEYGYCLFESFCVGDDLLTNRLKITQDLFKIEELENPLNFYWQILKNSDMIYLNFNLENENDFKNLDNLKNEMELAYYKNDGVKTVVIQNLKKLIKFKLDWGISYANQ